MWSISTMSRHLLRLLEIDSMIRDNRRFTTREMAEKLEVSERTLRSDIAFLRDRFNAPLDFSPKKGFHYTDKKWRLPSINLSISELFAVMLGAKMLESYAGSAYINDLDSAILRLTERVPKEIQINTEKLSDQRIIFTGGAETYIDPEILRNLVTAIDNVKQIKIEYYTASRDQFSERIVNPYNLRIHRGTNYYIIGFCHNRQAIRYFRVDRIKKLQLLSCSFARDPTFNIQDHINDSFQIELAEGQPQLVTIWFSPSTTPYVRDRRWHITQKIEEHADGSMILQMETTGLNDLKRWVLGYGGGALVLSPPELVNLVRAEVQQMVQNYGEK